MSDSAAANCARGRKGGFVKPSPDGARTTLKLIGHESQLWGRCLSAKGAPEGVFQVW